MIVLDVSFFVGMLIYKSKNLATKLVKERNPTYNRFVELKADYQETLVCEPKSLMINLKEINKFDLNILYNYPSVNCANYTDNRGVDISYMYRVCYALYYNCYFHYFSDVVLNSKLLTYEEIANQNSFKIFSKVQSIYTLMWNNLYNFDYLISYYTINNVITTVSILDTPQVLKDAAEDISVFLDDVPKYCSSYLNIDYEGYFNLSEVRDCSYLVDEDGFAIFVFAATITGTFSGFTILIAGLFYQLMIQKSDLGTN